ncbi:MAG: hypothetical protein FJX35_21420 [Alphaproteobacteria bacterium]|nr:hypothetical protein [Alphaproteobacteria bacterium]
MIKEGLAAASVVFGLMMLVPSRCSASPAEEAAQALVGEWIVQIGKERRQRALGIESVRAGSDGALIAAGAYGFADAALDRYEFPIQRSGNGYALKLTTRFDSVLTGQSESAEKMLGEFRVKDGKVLSAEFILATREPPTPGKVPVIPSGAKVTMLFVTAWDCYYCGVWIAVRVR